MKKTDSKRFYSLLILSAVFLTNPNINIIDIMPDFVAWFILAKLFERAADSAPYFEEARSSFLKLAWINLAKVPAFFLMITIRSKDTLDNNVFALFSLSFCAIELVFLLPAIKNLFTALFHLGERTSANFFNLGLIIRQQIGKSTSYPKSSGEPQRAITLSHPSAPPKSEKVPSSRSKDFKVLNSSSDKKLVKVNLPLRKA